MCVCGRRGRGGGVQSDTPTPTPTHCRPTTHTTHNEQTHNTEHARWHRQFCLPKICPRRVIYHLTPEVHQRNPWIFYIFSLRIDREQHLSDSSNHSLYLIKLFSFTNLEGSSGRNQRPDGSIRLYPLLLLPSLHTTTTHKNAQRQRHRDRETETQRQGQNPSITNDLHVRLFPWCSVKESP